VDLDGNLGSDLFGNFTPEVLPSFDNTGAATITAGFADVSAVEPRDYKLRFDGVNWNFSDAMTGQPLSPTGSGTAGDPFVIDGLAIVVGGGAAAAGDEVRVRPALRAASQVSVTMLDGDQIAAARPLTTAPALGNGGGATVSDATVNNFSNPALLDSVRVVFDSPPTSYVITDASGTPLTGSIAWSSGDDISFNGWTLQIDGAPLANDTFTIDSSGAGNGDNANANELAALFSDGYFNNGQSSVQELSAQLTTSVGSFAARSSAELSVQSTIEQQLAVDVESVSGVNLEEEAVNMLRYQEAYQAASKAISVANDLFQTLIAAIR